MNYPALIGLALGAVACVYWLIRSGWFRQPLIAPRWLRALMLLGGSAVLTGMSAVTGAGLGAAAGNGYTIIMDNGAPATSRQILNFIPINGSVTVADNPTANRTDVTIVTGDGGYPSFPGVVPSALFYDYTNSSGNASDANACTSAAAPCATANGILTKQGLLTNLNGGVEVTVPFQPSSGYTIINIMGGGAPTNTDWWSLKYNLQGALVFRSYPVPMAGSHSGTFTAITPRVRTPTASTSPWLIVDSALPANNSWGSYINNGDYIVDTTQGICAWGLYDMSTDTTTPMNKTLRTSEWVDCVDYTATVPSVVHATPIVGDAYTVYPTANINISSIDSTQSWLLNPNAFEQNGPRLTLDHVTVSRGGRLGSPDFALQIARGSLLITTVMTYFDVDINISNGNNNQFFATTFASNVGVGKGGKGFFYTCNDNSGYPEGEPGGFDIQGNAFFSDDCSVGAQSAASPRPASVLVESGAKAVLEGGFAAYTNVPVIKVNSGGVFAMLVAGSSIYGGLGDWQPQLIGDVSGKLSYPIGQSAANSFAVHDTIGDFELSGNPTACALQSSGVMGCGITISVANLDATTASGGFSQNAQSNGTGAYVCQDRITE